MCLLKQSAGGKDKGGGIQGKQTGGVSICIVLCIFWCICVVVVVSIFSFYLCICIFDYYFKANNLFKTSLICAACNGNWLQPQ